MNKKFITGMAVLAILFMMSASGAAAADLDQNKLKTGAVKVQDFSLPAVQQPAVKGAGDGPIDSQLVGLFGPSDSQGVIAPIDHKVDAPVGVHDKAFDVFHKHTGEIKAAFGKVEMTELEPPPPTPAEKGGLIGPPDSHIDGPDWIVGPDELQHKGGAVGVLSPTDSQAQGILIGMHKAGGEAQSGAVVGISEEVEAVGPESP